MGRRRSGGSHRRCALAAVGGKGPADCIELRLDEAVILALGIELGEGGLIRRARFARPAGCGEDVTAQVLVDAGKRLVALRIERAERVVVLLRLELDLGETNTGDLFQLVPVSL